jgi:hypothetical protein
MHVHDASAVSSYLYLNRLRNLHDIACLGQIAYHVPLPPVQSAVE